jgi:hypothetical protein
MEKYESGEYTETVMESIRVLRDQSKQKELILKSPLFFFSRLVMPSFAERIKIAIDTLRMKLTYDDGKVN